MHLGCGDSIGVFKLAALLERDRGVLLAEPESPLLKDKHKYVPFVRTLSSSGSTTSEGHGSSILMPVVSGQMARAYALAFEESIKNETGGAEFGACACFIIALLWQLALTTGATAPKFQGKSC